MAVAVLDDWSGQTAGSPTGSLTISAGSDRLLWVVYFAETGGTHTYTSITVGTVAPTGTLVEESTASPNTFIWSWYWDEAAIASMTGTTASITKGGTPTVHDWDYIVFSGASDGAEYATSVDVATQANTSISTTSVSSVNDFIAVAINRESENRDITAYDNLTEGWQFNTDYSIAVADGVGGDDDVALTGDGFNGDWFVQLLHIKAAAAATAAITMKHLHEAMLK
jgi:hypothetical protein